MATTKSERGMKAEQLEAREQPNAAAVLNGGVLGVLGDVLDNRIEISRDGSDIVVHDQKILIGRFAAAQVTSIQVQAGDGNDVVKVDQNVLINTILNGGDGDDRISGGGAMNTVNGGNGDDVLKGGLGVNSFDGGAGTNNVLRVVYDERDLPFQEIRAPGSPEQSTPSWRSPPQT